MKKQKNIWVIFTAKQWKDKNTGHWIIYHKKFEISAYGKTMREAKEMFISQVYEFLKMSKPPIIKG